MQITILTNVILPSGLFIIMLGMGLSLVVSDFKRVLIYPKAVFIGTIGQILILPVFGFLLASNMPISKELAVGIMLLVACPGGTTSNLITHLAKGDTALSITLTAVSSLITIITIPLIVGTSIGYFMIDTQQIELPIMKMIGTLIAITLLPVSIGMAIRSRAPVFAIKQEVWVNKFSTIFLSFLVVGIVFQQRDVIWSAIIQVGPIAALLNVSTMLVGFLLAQLFSLDNKQKISISLEVGIQNSALAILIATTILNNSVFAIAPAIYSLVMYLTSGIIIALVWRSRKRHKA